MTNKEALKYPCIGCEITYCNKNYDKFDKWLEIAEKALEEQSKIVHCKECKYSHMTMSGDCKYCDIHSKDSPVYFPGDYFCADGEV